MAQLLCIFIYYRSLYDVKAIDLGMYVHSVYMSVLYSTMYCIVLNQVCTLGRPKAGCGHMSDLLILFSEK